MSLPLPRLDDRRFDDLFEEARSLIPRFCPAWTDHNAHDPGITLIELFAWLVDTQLHRLDRIPARHREAFARLLGIARREAEPAQVLLWPADGDPGPVGGFVPAGTRVTLQERAKLGFATAEDVFLTAARIVGVSTVGQSGPADHFAANALDGTRYMPFGDPAGTGARLVVRLRPGFREPRARLWFQLEDTALPPLPAVEDGACAPPFRSSARLAWSWREPRGRWAPLPLIADETANLTRSGAVTFRVPVPCLAEAEIAVELAEGGFEIAPELLCVDVNVLPVRQVGSLRGVVIGSGTGDPDLSIEIGERDVPASLWLPAPSGRAVAAGDLIDRAGFLELLAEPPDPLVSHVAQAVAGPRPPHDDDAAWIGLLAAVDAALSSDDLYERVAGGSDVGRMLYGAAWPLQSLPARDDVGRRARAEFVRAFDSVLAPEDLVVETDEEGRVLRWRRVDDLFASCGSDLHFTLDERRTRITFGNGVNGRIPPEGCRIDVAHARTCEGTEGHVDALRQWTVLHPGAGRAWTNPFGSTPGRDRDTALDLSRRALRRARERRRAVTAADVESLALATPGIRVARAFARFGRRPDVGAGADVPGSVTVVVVPHARPERALRPPEATPAFLANVEAHLRAHRLVGDEVFVAQPVYVEIAVKATLHLHPEADGVRVALLGRAALDALLAPLRYEAGRASGRALGADVFESEILAVLDSIDGVAFVDGVELLVDGTAAAPDAGRPLQIEIGERKMAVPGAHVLSCRPLTVERDARGSDRR